MSPRRFRISESDAAQRYARRLRAVVTGPVRVVRSRGQVLVQVVEDERRRSLTRNPDRRAASRPPGPGGHQAPADHEIVDS